MNLLTTIKEKVQTAYNKNGFDGANTFVRLSDRPDISDYQSNGALSLAKVLKQNPRAIAQKIADVLRSDSFFETVTVDGPGFINMKVSDKVLGEMAYDILSGEKGGYERESASKTVIIDYSSPNLAKAMHVGHLRSNVIGESIKRLMKFAGDKVISDNHIGDWGKPMGLLITAIQERQPDLPYFDDNFKGSYPKEVPFTGKDLEDMYPLAAQRAKVDEAFEVKAHENTKLLQDGRPGHRALWQHFVDESIKEMNKIYDEFDIQFDLWRGESYVHERLGKMVKKLEEQGIVILDDGAKIIPLGQSKNGNDMPPLIMVKSNGAFMYGATDLATIEDRVEEFKPDVILYVVDLRQGLHFEQVFKAAQMLGLTNNLSLEHLGFGTVNGKDNKPFKTRDGGVMTLRALIDLASDAALKKMNAGEMGRDLTEDEKIKISKIVGLSALKFADLINERTKNYIFDEDKLTSTEGKTGPYILYAIVRMKSILEKMNVSDEIFREDIPVITTPAERGLLLRLYAMPEAVQTAYDNRAAHVIADYLFKLAQDFNLFYHDCPIKDADEDTKKSRIALTKYALHIASLMADLLGLRVPDKM